MIFFLFHSGLTIDGSNIFQLMPLVLGINLWTLISPVMKANDVYTTG